MVKVIIGDSLIVETIYYVVYLGYINPFSLPIFPVSHLADQTFHTSRLWSDLISKV